jgi:serine/threonine protein kinase
MSDCLTRELLIAYLKETLDGLQRTAVESHLASCDKCLEVLNEEADDSGFRREYLVGEASRPAVPVVEGSGVTNPENEPATFGRYEVELLLGKGGIGEVWRAYDPILRRHVAIKTRRRDRIAGGRFLEEAQALASLSHEGIVVIYDSGATGDRVFMVTELLLGGTLQERLRASPMEMKEAVSLMARMARAVHAAHRSNFVHRDIKPSNIIFDASGIPKLTDFGLAVPILELRQNPAALEGTIPYMSPEQASGDQAIGYASDIYSLGVVLFELATGKLPHCGENAEETRRLIQFTPAEKLRMIDAEIPEWLEDVCARCLEKLPDQRYSSAGALAEELESWLRVLDPGPEKSTVQARRGKTLVTRRRALTTMGALSASGMLGGMLWPRGTRVRVVTNPPGARVVVYPINRDSGLPEGRRRIEAWNTSPAMLSLNPGFYLVVAALDDRRFHEVFRTVPESLALLPSEKRHLTYENKGSYIEWHEIEISDVDSDTASMGYFPGSTRFTVGAKGDAEAPEHSRRIPPFYLDPFEVTLADCRRMYRGQLLPSIAGRKSIRPENFPIAHVWWDDAVGYAEKRGMRLPSEAEYEFAATNMGASRFPWGDTAECITSWPLGPVGQPLFDCVVATNPVYGLYSNVPEWTSTPSTHYPRNLNAGRPSGAPDEFIVRGAPPSVIQGDATDTDLRRGPRARVSLARKSSAPIGFRCARSARPRLTADDLECILVDS